MTIPTKLGLMTANKVVHKVDRLKKNLPSLTSANDSDSLFRSLKHGPLKVAVVGSGNWGSAICKVIATNTNASYMFENQVKVWVLEEKFNGELLTDIMNRDHENTKYLPGVKLPTNLVASSNLEDVVEDADLLCIVVPHQFINSICQKMVGRIKPGAKAISLIKGMNFEDGYPKLISSTINSILGIEVSVLSGANVAKDVAREQFCETTIGFSNSVSAMIWQQLFDTPYFRVNCLPDVIGVEICGALKNIIALSAGFADGMNYGTNTKSALIRIGVMEIKLFACIFYKGILEDTFYDSAGFADVITTCFGGRHVKCAREFMSRGGKSSWKQIEDEILNGQKLQGHECCHHVYEVIAAHDLQGAFPLFCATYKIAFDGANGDLLLDTFMNAPCRKIKPIKDCCPCLLPEGLKQTHDEISVKWNMSACNSPRSAEYDGIARS